MSQFIEMFGNPVTNNKEWNTLPIKDVAPETPSIEKQTGKVWILNLDMIESNTGKVVEKVFENDSNLLSVAPFDEGNVLYSKLRPYLNKVVIPDGKGYATTELVPLRPNQKLLNLTFFSHLLRGDEFVTYANSISAGTKMPRMPLNDLRKFQCILPPMEKQNEFEEIARQADKSGFDELKSQFIEMFGDPLKNPKNYTQRKLGDVATLLNGRAYKASELLSSGRYLVLRVGNFFTNTDYYYSDLELEPDKYCDTGDILYSWSATLGAQIWKGGKVIYHYHIWKVLFDENILNKEYFCFMLNVMTDSLKQETHGSTMVHLTKDGMEKKFIAIPPLELQRRFVSIAEQADKSGSVLQYMIAC